MIQPDNNPKVSIVIVTRNRKEEVLQAIESCLRQTYEPLEVIIYDDASTDGTSEVIEHFYSGIRVIRSEIRKGYIAHRNRGFQDADGEFIFSLDDDSFYTSATTVEETVDLFRRHPRAAAIALPYIEPTSTSRNKSHQPFHFESQYRNFIGCAHAIRKTVACELNGYREFFVHQGEERDLSIRLLEAGWTIVGGTSEPLIHLYSPKRDKRRMSYYGIRNTLLFDVMNIPAPYILPRFLVDSLKLFWHNLNLLRIPTRTVEFVFSYLACLRYFRHRSPVRSTTYLKYRSLPAHGANSVEDASGFSHSNVLHDVRPPSGEDSGILNHQDVAVP